MPIGYHPIAWKAAAKVPSLTIVQRITNVAIEHIVQEVVTEAMRPRITDGASRDRFAEGRVVEEM
jgi:hypothetical protein